MKVKVGHGGGGGKTNKKLTIVLSCKSQCFQTYSDKNE